MIIYSTKSSQTSIFQVDAFLSKTVLIDRQDGQNKVILLKFCFLDWDNRTPKVLRLHITHSNASTTVCTTVLMRIWMLWLEREGANVKIIVLHAKLCCWNIDSAWIKYLGVQKLVSSIFGIPFTEMVSNIIFNEFISLFGFILQQDK